MSSAAVWHEVECGGYAADLAGLGAARRARGAARARARVRDGRVALHLARRGHEVWAVDVDPALLEALCAHAAARSGLPVRDGMRRRPRPGAGPGVRADHRPDAADPDARRRRSAGAALERAAARTSRRGPPRGRDRRGRRPPRRQAPAPPFPTSASVDGWVYSSLPVAVPHRRRRRSRSAGCARRSRPTAS